MIVAVLAAVQWVQREQQRRGAGTIPQGTEVPAVTLLATDGGPALPLESLEGRPVVLTFWATWCTFCRAELPVLDALHDEAEGRYAVVTVSQERPDVIQRFMASRGEDLPLYWDTHGELDRAFGVTSLPTTVIVDAQGRVVHDFVGAADLDVLREHMTSLTDGP